MKKYITHILILLTVLSFFFTVFPKKDIFTSRYDVQYWQTRYEQSGWAKGWEAQDQIGDAELYAYAGWRQIQGDDPTKINAEVPPLGRYLFGLSILFLGNPYWVALFSGLALLLVTLLISRKILIDPSWSIVPVLLLSLDRLFREDLSTSMLDLPFSVFVTLSFYFLIKGRENHRWYPFLAASLAAVSSTKMYLVGFGLTAVNALYLAFLFLIFHYKDIFWFVISLPVFLVVYIGSYIVYFLNNHNLGDFKYLHFWIRHFARVQVEHYPRFEIFRILLVGKWKTWWEGSGIIKVDAWNPLWGMGGLLAPIAGILGLFRKNLNLFILCLWVFTFLGMFSFGVPYPRYLLPVLPAIYILVIFSFKRFLELKIWANIKR